MVCWARVMVGGWWQAVVGEAGLFDESARREMSDGPWATMQR